MLDKEFLRPFFNQLEAFSDDQLTAKIEATETLAKSFQAKSEAALDARFLLKHLRREALQRQFKPTLQ